MNQILRPKRKYYVWTEQIRNRNVNFKSKSSKNGNIIKRKLFSKVLKSHETLLNYRSCVIYTLVLLNLIMYLFKLLGTLNSFVNFKE